MSRYLSEIVKAADKKLAAVEKGEKISFQTVEGWSKLLPPKKNLLQIIRNYESPSTACLANDRATTKYQHWRLFLRK